MDILLVASRLPWPPTSADRIRSWHLLEHLSRTHRVHLAAFVDDPDDWSHAPRIERMCASACLRPSSGFGQALRLPAALIAGRPLSTGLQGDAVMRRWLTGTLRAGIDVSVALSSASAALLIDRDDARPAVLDLVDCESETWAQRAAEARWPWRWALRREHRLVRAHERAAAWFFDRTILVSPVEADIMTMIAPESASRLVTIGNGVDIAYFDPALRLPGPYADDGRRTIVLTGTMDEAANVEAARWIAHQVMPRLRAARLPVRFAIVGARPVAAVRRLASSDDILVTGAVDDVRPWLRHAAVALAPLRLSRGVPSKILEAMAMARPVVATPGAVRGVDAEPGEHLLLAEGADRWSEVIAALLRDPARAELLGVAARRRVIARHCWDDRLARIDGLLRELVTAEPASAPIERTAGPLPRHSSVRPSRSGSA